VIFTQIMFTTEGSSSWIHSTRFPLQWSKASALFIFRDYVFHCDVFFKHKNCLTCQTRTAKY